MNDEFKKRKSLAGSMLKSAAAGAGLSVAYDNMSKGGTTKVLEALAGKTDVDAVSGATLEPVSPSALDLLKSAPEKLSSKVASGLDSGSKYLGFEGLEAANKAVGNAVAVGLGGAAGGALAHLVVRGAKAAGRKLKGDMSSKPKDVLYHINYADSHFRSMEPIIEYGKKNKVDNHETWKGYLESASMVKKSTPKEAKAYTDKINKISAEAKAEGK